ncbi:hypothetical protein GCM10022199_05840 [Marihabitans asiaticum]|uniref:hypothetical protein n=1 Tax=Marihabitans asiaticum TaxID=415218 RepID=UPI0014783DD6|nr:hypothetical protein [Marihabitans asiaticum]
MDPAHLLDLDARADYLDPGMDPSVDPAADPRDDLATRPTAEQQSPFALPDTDH